MLRAICALSTSFTAHISFARITSSSLSHFFLKGQLLPSFWRVFRNLNEFFRWFSGRFAVTFACELMTFLAVSGIVNLLRETKYIAEFS